MSVQIVRVGAEQTPVVVIDGFVESPEDLVDQAAAMAPFPAQAGNFYPGLRRYITAADGASFDYVQAITQGVAPLITKVFGVEALELIEASYSMVTTPPEALQALQSRPHVDTYAGGHFAILHYLMPEALGGTGFYRHTRSGFETLTPERAEAFQEGVERDERLFGPPTGYYSGNANGFAEIATVEARFNRAVIYPGNLLHSGLIPQDFAFSDDPRRGRLTANLFVRAAS